jgi:hypothetical protein
MDGLREDGQPIPHPSTVAGTVITRRSVTS